jgi:hypothetical protein
VESQKRSLRYMVTAPATAQWVYEDLMLDLRPQLKDVSIPIVEITLFDPSLDGLGPAKIANAGAKERYYRSFLASAPSVSMQVIAPARHFVMYDQPEKLHAALAAQL